MENKIALFFIRRSVKISVAVLSVLPSLALILNLLSLTTESNEIIKFSVHSSADVIVDHGGLGEIIAASLFAPLIRAGLILSVICGPAAIVLAVFNKKATDIISYIFSCIPNLAVAMSISVVCSLIEEMPVTYSPVLYIVMFWSSLFMVVPFGGIVFSAFSKNKTCQ